MVDKLIRFAVLGVIFFTGCGSDSKKEETSVEKNILTIQAEGFSDKINVDLKEGDYSLSAKGNESDVSLSFRKLKGENDILYGDLRLLASEHKAGFAILAWGDYRVLFCISYLECVDNTEYRFDRINRKLTVSFKNNNNRLFKNYLEGGGNWNKSVPAIISGDLVFKIPSNWLAFNKNRFPEISSDKSLKLADKTYQISEISSDIAFYKDDNGRYIGSIDQLDFQNAEEVVSLHIYHGIESGSSFKDTRLEIFNYNKNGENIFSFVDSIPSSFIKLNNSGEILSFNIKNLNLYFQEQGITKTLDLNFTMPRYTSNMQVNDENVLLSTSNIDFAYVINDRKIYAINLKNYSSSYFLNIIQEFNGSLSIESIDGESKVTCGDRNNSCLGLSMNSDKKTVKFDNVKLGEDVLNGTIYIAGVLNSR
ncbi:hypothetical protein [Acinetobacter venetianus]